VIQLESRSHWPCVASPPSVSFSSSSRLHPSQRAHPVPSSDGATARLPDSRRAPSRSARTTTARSRPGQASSIAGGPTRSTTRSFPPPSMEPPARRPRSERARPTRARSRPVRARSGAGATTRVRTDCGAGVGERNEWFGDRARRWLLALLRDPGRHGRVVCWGDNWMGTATPPASVNGTSGAATAVAAGGSHSCAIRAGTGAGRVLGAPTRKAKRRRRHRSTAPRAPRSRSRSAATRAARSRRGPRSRVLARESSARAGERAGAVNGTAGTASGIAAGSSHACAIQRETGAVVCWGANSFGQATPPPEVNGTGRDRRSRSAASANFNCAVQAGTQTVYCWGRPRSARAALCRPSRATAVRSTARKARHAAITGGFGYSCAIRAGTDAVLCWGDGSSARRVRRHGRRNDGQRRPRSPAPAPCDRAPVAVACWGPIAPRHSSIPPYAVERHAGTATAIDMGRRGVRDPVRYRRRRLLGPDTT
jgi:hypothetical protein